MKRNTERIRELVNMIHNGRACVFACKDEAPETFAVDMACLFKADTDRDVLRNVFVGNEEGMGDSILVVISESVERNELFIKLADYVNGIGMNYAFCCCKDKDDVYKMYEIDLGDEYVEGGYEPFFDNCLCPVVGEWNIAFIEDELELGIEKEILPSPTMMFVDQGEHYIKRLIGLGDEDLI